MLIGLAEWARRVGITHPSARQKAERGAIPAVKIGRNWVIDDSVKNIDNRCEGRSRRWEKQQ